MQTVGELIREARESVGLSQRELVEQVNRNFAEVSLSRRHLSNVELGASNISFNKARVIFSTLSRFGAR